MTLLIFDCDGTVIDSELLHAQIDVEYLKERFGVTRDVIEHNRRFIGMGLKQFYEALEQDLGYRLPPDFDAALHKRKDEIFATQTKPVPHIIETLQVLASTPHCIASNTPLATIEVSLAAAKLYDFFAPNIFSAQMVARGKPAPDLFLYAALKMNTAPNDCIVIEDSVHGIEAAHGAGMHVLGYIGGGHCYPDYKDKLSNADRIFADMRELPSLVQSFINGANGK